MNERHFACTACGKCCYGWLPLTLEDALANAHRFPLAMVWTPVPSKARSYALATRLGITFRIDKRREVALLLSPTAYIPPSMACPALSANNLCAIHESKPLRCKTMPFYPYHEESDQLEFLVPRKGWSCTIKEDAPVVYKDKKIIGRTDFDKERKALLENAAVLRAYGEAALKHNPTIRAHVVKALAMPIGGKAVVNFSSFIRQNKSYDMEAFAARQYPVLKLFEERTAEKTDMKDYHAFYRETAKELEWFIKQKPQA